MKSKSGFTLVELLIVIVVIAVLAAISVVVYNGVQKRAQNSAVSVETADITRAIELYNAANGTYPTSISACPTPTSDQLCIPLSSGVDISYQRITPGVAAGSGYIINNTDAYSITAQNDGQFIFTSNAERTGTREFMQYADLAPFIDRYGLRRYEVSFDIKSADTSVRNAVNVYFQNGTAINGTWRKANRNAPLELLDSDGEPLSLVRGQTWIAAVPNGKGSVSR